MINRAYRLKGENIMQYTKKEREKYNQNRKRACQALNMTANNYNWLRRKGNELHKLYEEQCNGTIEDSIATERENKLYDVIDKYVKELNLFVYYQTDPRGATIYLDTKVIPRDNYTQAVCIY